MGSQSSIVAESYDKKAVYRSCPQARSDAALPAALLSRLTVSASARRSPLKVTSSSHPQSEITLDTFTGWQNTFEQDDKAQLASTLLSKQHIASALLNRKAISANKQIFSHTLTVQPQSYLCFYDHLEKCNYFYENMLDLIEEPINSCIISHLSTSPLGDGRQWDMVVGLVKKYGLVPKSIYDESYNSSNSSGINTFLTSKIRDHALELQQIYKDTKAHAMDNLGQDSNSATIAGLQAAHQAKEVMMAKVYCCLAIGLLESPPSPTETFEWDYLDKSSKAHSIVSTPLDFYHKHCAGFQASEYISLINDPRNSYNKSYTVKRLYIEESQSGFNKIFQTLPQAW
ncbi:peptidase C1-like family-domain-containing protein [Melampsora americana]|nr:peptidase C1-like family-domain-containing protein [Melampsora americana]